MPDSSFQVAELINAFRQGDVAAGDALLQRYRPWLTLLARTQIDAPLRGRFDASDIAQQTMLEAVRAFGQFRGSSGAELIAWLRQILAHALAHEVRKYRGSKKRDISREISMDQQLAVSSQRLQAVLAANDPSPSGQAQRHEQEVLLAEVLESLPADYREVIVLRNLDGLSHEEIAQRMGRSVGAVRMLWVRALARLRKEAEARGL